jgi:photosystem II stability/assembly factor-like uncharacterized protein
MQPISINRGGFSKVFGSESLTRMFRNAKWASRGPGRSFCLWEVALLILLLVSLGWAQGSEWKWLTGGKLNRVKFIGQKGWIIGDDGNQGIILHTTNSGDTWAIQPHNTGRQYFNGLSVVDSLNAWIGGGSMGGSGFILRTRDGGRNWVEEYNRSGMQLNDIDYVDTLHGWFTASFPTVDTIYRTTNGGITWQGIQPDTSRNRAYGPIDFVDSLNGCAVSPGGIFTLSRTTDGGLTWTTMTDAFLPFLLAIDMADSVKGWASGEGDVMVRTRDGWTTWQTTTGGPYIGIYGISFGDTMNGWAVGGDNGHNAMIFHSTNGGATWTYDSTLTQDNAFHGVDAANINTAFATGSGGSIVKTTNSGNTWTVIRNTDIGAYSTFLNVAFWDANRGWATGTYGVITHTTNGGTVWNRQVSGISSFLYGIDFPSSQKGWICTDGGGVLGTTNGGNTWVGESTGTTHPLFSIDFADTLFGVAVGGYYGPPEPPEPEIRDQGFGVKARGIEQVWTGRANYEIASSYRYNGTPRNDAPWGQDTIKPWGTGQDFWKYPWKPEETALTTPYRAIIRTTNGGALWIAQNTSGQVPLYGVSFATPREGWACGDPQGGMGVILHTTDSGATWTGQSSNVNQALNWIQFRGTQTGWCVGTNGTALWTTDGGNTWNQGTTGITAPLWSCAFYNSLNGFACGNNGLLIKTTDGGRNWTPDTSKVYANLMAVNALDSLHAWTVGSYGIVLGWREAGVSGIDSRGQGDKETRGQRIALEQSYPNPMRENCAIGYWLNNGQGAELSIYDITGRRVRSFASLRMTDSGRHTVIWDGKDETNRKVPPGVYFYQLRVKELTETKKLVRVQ